MFQYDVGLCLSLCVRNSMSSAYTIRYCTLSITALTVVYYLSKINVGVRAIFSREVTYQRISFDLKVNH